jgi:hypothetical protein
LRNTLIVKVSALARRQPALPISLDGSPLPHDDGPGPGQPQSGGDSEDQGWQGVLQVIGEIAEVILPTCADRSHQTKRNAVLHQIIHLRLADDGLSHIVTTATYDPESLILVDELDAGRRGASVYNWVVFLEVIAARRAIRVGRVVETFVAADCS